jgi:hypothetical protein
VGAASVAVGGSRCDGRTYMHVIAICQGQFINKISLSDAVIVKLTCLGAHLAGEDDELAKMAPSRTLIPDFAVVLAAPADPATTTRIARAPTIGRPLGAPEWVALERRNGSQRRAAAWPRACTRPAHKCCGSIDNEIGTSLPMNIGRSTCE